MTNTPSTTRAVLSLLLAGLLLCACLLPACAVDLRDLPDWVRAQLFPVELDYQGMYPIPGLAPTLTPVAPAAAAGPGTPATVSIPGAGDVGALRPIGGSPAGARPDGLATVGGPGAAAAMGGLHTVGGPTVTAGGLGNLHTVGGPTVTGTLGALGTVSVPGGRPGDLTALGGVSVSGAAPRTGDLQAFATKGIGRGAQCIDVIRAKRMTPKQFVAWADENGITTDEIVAAMQYSGIDWPELAPESMPLAAALHARIGDELTGIADLPMIARLLLATYFGKQHRDDDVQRVYSAITDDELKAEPKRNLHCASSHLMDDAPMTALGVLERYAVVLRERALLCTEFRVACAWGRLPRETVRDRLIPFAQQAIREMPPTDHWLNAFQALVWGHRRLGDEAAALREGRECIQRARDLGVTANSPELLRASLAVGQLCASTGQVTAAVKTLSDVVATCPTGSYTSRRAQAALITLARSHPVVGPASILPPRFERVSPEEMAIEAQVGKTERAAVELRGGPTFSVLDARCTLPFIATRVAAPQIGEADAVQLVELSVRPTAGLGDERGTLIVTTNDAGNPTVVVPVKVCVGAPVTASPETLFFGFVGLGETRTAQVRLDSTLPFTIPGTAVDRPEIVRVDVRQTTTTSVIVEATLLAPTRPATVQGTIQLRTSVQPQPGVHIPYYAHVHARD